VVRTELSTTKRGSVYIAEYAGLEAEDMRTAFTITALADGVATGTPLTWSVEGYVNEARQLSTTDPVELALFNALLIYVDSVAAAG
jgi:hypothetical protein